MNTATPLGAQGCSVISLGPHGVHYLKHRDAIKTFAAQTCCSFRPTPLYYNLLLEDVLHMYRTLYRFIV